MSEEFRATSTLVPLLLLWAAVLEMKEAYLFIRDNVLPAIPKTTLNFWSSDAGFDMLVADPVSLQQHGVGEAVLNIPVDPTEFLRTMSTPLLSVESIDKSAWYQFRAAYVPLLAALHWRLQVPREALVKHAIALTERGAEPTATH